MVNEKKPREFPSGEQNEYAQQKRWQDKVWKRLMTLIATLPFCLASPRGPLTDASGGSWPRLEKAIKDAHLERKNPKRKGSLKIDVFDIEMIFFSCK